ncbi:MAG: PsbP-related protein [Patescibacteria group bacterium]
MNKKNIIVIISILGILLIGGSVWYVQKNNQPDNEDHTTQAPQEGELIASDIDTSDWQTYRNEEYGFEFMYPEGWGVVLEGESFVNLFVSNDPLDEGSFKVKVFNNPEKLSVPDFYKAIAKQKLHPGNDLLLYNLEELAADKETISIGQIKGVNYINILGIIETTAIVASFDDRLIEVTLYGVSSINEDKNYIKVLTTLEVF